ncbi:oxidoreductase, partial [Candidatus Pelagibacter sp.]|nr:oxidoreductase [Candidatus Pelagibacter sp.]
MKNINIFCFGFGQVAKNFIKKLIIEKYNINLSVTSRSETSKKFFKGINYNSYLFNSEKFDQNLVVKLKEADHILVSIPPEKQEDLVVKNFSKFLESSKVKWITYLSATSVYGDHKGKWVNENSKTNPISNKGVARLKAENSWIFLEKKNKLPVQIFRLSGIYSNEKNILVRLKSGDVKLINKKNHYFSRIHVDDIANILFKSLLKFKSGEIYNLSDDKPSSSKEITLYGAKMLNIENIEVHEIES